MMIQIIENFSVKRPTTDEMYRFVANEQFQVVEETANEYILSISTTGPTWSRVIGIPRVLEGETYQKI